VDVGCGTGISSRLFAQRGIPVLGIEPNEEMRRRACETPSPDPHGAPRFQEGKAEATGLGDGCADLVLAAQAFHWFAADLALAEFHRVLKPEGWIVLMWNERDESDPFTAAYGAIIRSAPSAARLEKQRGQAGEPLLTCPLVRNARRVAFQHVQHLDEQGIIGRALSASYAPREPREVEAFVAALRDVFARFQEGGNVDMQYETSVYLGKRKGPARGPIP
jgi:SAM-dependent methyltransferase